MSTDDIKLLINLARHMGEVHSPRNYGNVIHICVPEKRNIVCAVCTDGFGLIKQELKSLDPEFIPKGGFNIAVDMLRELGKAVPLSNSVSISYFPQDNQLRMATLRGGMTVRLSQMTFPRWEALEESLPKSGQIEVNINPHQLMKILKTFGAVKKDRYVTLKVHPDKNEIYTVQPSWAQNDFALVPPIKKQ